MNKGCRHGPPEVMEKLAKGMDAAPDEYYFRTSPVFEVERGKYDWLARSVFLGVGERHKDHVLIRFYG